MSKRIAVVISEDPTVSHRPVEALRIALGLCAGDHETTVVLLGPSPLLLTDNIDDIVDVDVLEKYRPSFAQLAIPFILDADSRVSSVREDFATSRLSSNDIRSFIRSVDRTLVFS